ncbi:MAG: septal ring lytic transglycosylase RlpA family protein [Candidatus Hydrogenedentes bacterium]|nr:septal ring lytic transglycosylase RlpA family protein [Candidatus Hydrogenedentota bacterium]
MKRAARKFTGRATLALSLLLLLGSCASTPDTVAGRYSETGLASWYGKPYHGRPTASGERFNRHDLTAAHRTLPFGTVIKVKHLGNGRTVKVTINDRGPFVKGRIIDLSEAAAKRLNMLNEGVARVRVTALH